MVQRYQRFVATGSADGAEKSKIAARNWLG